MGRLHDAPLNDANLDRKFPGIVCKCPCLSTGSVKQSSMSRTVRFWLTRFDSFVTQLERRGIDPSGAKSGYAIRYSTELQCNRQFHFGDQTEACRIAASPWDSMCAISFSLSWFALNHGTSHQHKVGDEQTTIKRMRT
eukprot:185065-Amphidinium_carterae.1